MDKNKLYQLLSAYLTQRKAGAKNTELNKLIRHTSDEELGSVLSDLWNEYELTESYDSEVKAAFKSIKRRIQTKRIIFQTAHFARYAAIFLIPFLSYLTVTLLVERNNLNHENSVFSVRVAPGESSEVMLPDGTEVMLNSQSEISYYNDYKENKRVVNLKGEANFKVTKNPDKPFIVSTECIDVEVLGTTFNVKTYESDNMQEVSLMEGKVKLTTRNQVTNSSIFLQPNEKATFNKATGKLVVKQTDASREAAWMKGLLVFQTKSLADINKELERKFDVKIQMNYPAIEQDSFTGVFDNKSLIEVLENLKIHYGFDYAIMQNQVTIYPTAKK